VFGTKILKALISLIYLTHKTASIEFFQGVHVGFMVTTLETKF